MKFFKFRSVWISERHRNRNRYHSIHRQCQLQVYNNIIAYLKTVKMKCKLLFQQQQLNIIMLIQVQNELAACTRNVQLVLWLLRMNSKSNVTKFAGRFTATSKWNIFIRSDRDVKLNTGLLNNATLNSLYALLQPRAERMRYWLGSKRTSKGAYKWRLKCTPRKSGPCKSLTDVNETENGTD